MVDYNTFMSDPQYEGARGDLDYLYSAQKYLGRLHLMSSALNPDFVDSVANGSGNFSGGVYRFTDAEVGAAYVDSYSMILTGEGTPDAARGHFIPRALEGITIRAVNGLETGRRAAFEAISSGLYDQVQQGEAVLNRSVQEAVAFYDGIESVFTESLIGAGLSSRDIPVIMSEHAKRRQASNP